MDQLTLTQCLMLRNSYLDPLCRHHYIPKDLNYQLDSESEVAVQYTNDTPWRFCVRELQKLIRSDIESNARFYSPLKSFLSVRQIKLHIPLREAIVSTNLQLYPQTTIPVVVTSEAMSY